MTIETLGEIRAKYNFWNEKERPYYEALSEAIRVLNAQNGNCHYAKIVRCRECRWVHICRMGQHLGLDGFCSKGELEPQKEDA